MNETETLPEIPPAWRHGVITGTESQRSVPRPAHEPNHHSHAFQRVERHRCGSSQHSEPASCSRVCILLFAPGHKFEKPVFYQEAIILTEPRHEKTCLRGFRPG